MKLYILARIAYPTFSSKILFDIFESLLVKKGNLYKRSSNRKSIKVMTLHGFNNVYRLCMYCFCSNFIDLGYIDLSSVSSNEIY